MKKAISTLAILSTFSCFSQEYIVRYENSKKSEVQLTLSKFGETQPINVTFGHFLKLKTNQTLSSKKLSSLHEIPGVRYVEINQEYKTQVEPEELDQKFDPKFYQQWGLKNTGTNSGSIFRPGKKGEDINAEKAWEVEMGSEDIVVAVIDTGIEINHPDLRDNIYINEAELNGTEGIDDDGNGYIDDYQGYNFYGNTTDANDDNGHGTHCAGVIGAIHDNNKQIKGVMKNVKLMPIKFLNAKGSGTLEGAMLSIDYATKMNVHIMSNSWGGGGYSEALKEAINAAEAKGIIFTAAAGNSRNDNDKWPSYPASYENENIISVGAMDPSGTKASYSNYGKTTVDIFAPGSKIISTFKGGRVKSLSGTSMATPHVSGIVGLLLSMNRSMNASEIRNILIETSAKSRSLGDYSIGGRVDAHAALTAN